MKNRLWDRILPCVAGALLIIFGALAVALLIFPQNASAYVGDLLTRSGIRVAVVMAGGVMILVGIACLVLLLRSSGSKGKSISQKTENGELVIAHKALDVMVQKCLEQHKELSPQTVSLSNLKGGLMVDIQGTVAGGISIPLTVDTLQRQIKQYVTACSGIEVTSIRVEIESSGPDAPNAPFAIAAPDASAALTEGKASVPAESAVSPAEPSPEKVERETEGADSEPTAEELEKVEAEMPAPSPSEAEGAFQNEAALAAAAAADVMKNAAGDAIDEEDDRPMHQRLFATVEEPCVMPMPPVEENQNQQEGGED